MPPSESAFDARTLIPTLPGLPGVYRMLDGAGEVLYVGKAADLRKRVGSYFRARVESPKTRRLVEQVRGVEVTVTRTEGEALLLEQTLIKQLRPRYNVLLRDDKSYPYIHLSEGEFPRLGFHRGARRAPGRYFGPYPSAGAVRETLTLLQKVFRVRQCEDSFFRNRTRPCLQHQIQRCTAPCVGLIDARHYARDVVDTVRFLEGRGGEVIDELVGRMEAAATALRFEEAAVCRDRIAQLRRVQERQYVSGEGGDMDVVACAVDGGVACVQVFYFRAGRSLGNKAFFPRLPGALASEEVIGAFLGQYYLERDPPPVIVVSHPPPEAGLLAEALGERVGQRIGITARVRGERARWLEMARDNARHALAAHLASRAGMGARLEALQDALGLDEVPRRLECFDISHTRGEATVASCVVFDAEGPRKSDYRRYNIEGIAPGDDYAALRQALGRRYRRLRESEARLPDVLFIDGGKGQLAQALAVLEELQVQGVLAVGVAKGPERRAGLEVLHLSAHGGGTILPRDSGALHLVQQIRDEAHRFAITGHRQRRSRARRTSMLEGIEGVGPKRRQALLQQFGGLQRLSRAGVEDIAGVDGISRALAQRIYDALHEEG